jgi:kynureninase
VVASCFDFSGKRNQVVYSDLNFPSVMYFWEAQRACGARVHMVPTDDGITGPTERLLDAIDDQTLLVPVSHVIFRSSYIQDAKAIIEKAHRVGAHVVLDTFQSLGTVPVDVRALNVDFTCGGVLKWLCGGPESPLPYVRPDLGKKPAKIHWLVRTHNPFGFESTLSLCRAALPLHEWHLPHPGSGSGAPRTEDHQGGRHRTHPREAPDFT